MSSENYDPHCFSSIEEYARCRASRDREFGMPKTPYANDEIGRRINQLHFEAQAAMNDELGWHGTSRAELLKSWGLLTATVLLTLITALASSGIAIAQQQFQSDAPMASFFLVGGNDSDSLRIFLEQARAVVSKRADAIKNENGLVVLNIAILPLAAEKPHEVGRDLESAFTEIGQDAVTCQTIYSENPAGIQAGCNAIWIPGGKQSWLKLELQKQPKLLTQLKTFTGLIGGSSAGAMIMAPRMIAGGLNSGTLVAGELNIIDGLNIVYGVVIDTHGDRSPRDQRAAATLDLVPSAKMVILLNEDVGLLIRGNKAKVLAASGKGTVRVCSRGQNFESNYSKVAPGSIATIRGMVTDYLSPGSEFDLPSPQAVSQTSK